MEQQLRSWLRFCVYFGIYLDATPSTYSNNSTNCIQLNSTICITAKQSPNRHYTLQRCYNCLLCSISSALFVGSIYWHPFPEGLTLNWIAITILFTTRYIANLLILLDAVWKQRQHETFLLLLQEIEESFRLRLSWNARSFALLKQLKRFLIYQLVLSVIGLLPFMVATFVSVDYGGYFWRGVWFICTARVRTLQLLVYMQILRHFLFGLCAKLEQIVAYRMAPSRQLLDMDYGRLGTMAYFLAVREIYALLDKAFQLLNDFAGWSLLGIMTTFVLDLSSNFYWMLQSFDNFRGRRYYYLVDLWWFIPVATYVWYLCYLCDSCKQLGRRVAQLLSKIILLSSARSGVHYRLVLQQFSMQLQLQCIEVSARSFFVLDLPFVMSISTAMAMHLVILIQF
ncbi:putative gustatory receptor 39b [Rhagoletis pomonella]|uniref:putative gustatory receptor 39b n=1 Tax=Rhagoletis pomonella TaxID=28610 RepID=UPI001780D553|nr:putative gustatory receptor 39b [Rhagoletis pomonella]